MYGTLSDNMKTDTRQYVILLLLIDDSQKVLSGMVSYCNSFPGNVYLTGVSSRIQNITFSSKKRKRAVHETL
jgi:hypothetical protein